jgi:hypothetical protein
MDILEDNSHALNVNFQCGHCGKLEWRATVRWSDGPSRRKPGGSASGVVVPFATNAPLKEELQNADG